MNQPTPTNTAGTTRLNSGSDELHTTSSFENLERELALLKARQEAEFALSPAGQQMQIIKARQEADMMLTAVGQELQRFQINQRMGQMYANSKLVPDIYKGNVADCAIAVDMAARMGANVLMVMQNLYIVHGTPAWSSKFLISTINTCGRFEPLKYRFYEDGHIGRHDYWENEYKTNPTTGRKEKVSVKRSFDGTSIPNLCCVAYTSAKGSDEILESSDVSCRMAVQEGWWTKNQSKWPTMTKQMLMYRAAAFWQRTYAPEISMGFNTVEEVRDVVDTDYEEISSTQPTAETAAISSTSTRPTIAELARRAAKSEASIQSESEPTSTQPATETPATDTPTPQPTAAAEPQSPEIPFE